MRLARWLEVPVGIDAPRVAGWFGALAGVGSLIEPYWTGLAEVLLAVVGLAAVVRMSAGRRELRPGGTSLVTVVASAAAALALPPSWALGRGALLGAGAALSAHLAHRLRAHDGGAL